MQRGHRRGRRRRGHDCGISSSQRERSGAARALPASAAGRGRTHPASRARHSSKGSGGSRSPRGSAQESGWKQWNSCEANLETATRLEETQSKSSMAALADVLHLAALHSRQNKRATARPAGGAAGKELAGRVRDSGGGGWGAAAAAGVWQPEGPQPPLQRRTAGWRGNLHTPGRWRAHKSSGICDAKRLQRPHLGLGLQGLLQRRTHHVGAQVGVPGGVKKQWVWEQSAAAEWLHSCTQRRSGGRRRQRGEGRSLEVGHARHAPVCGCIGEGGCRRIGRGAAAGRGGAGEVAAARASHSQALAAAEDDIAAAAGC